MPKSADQHCKFIYDFRPVGQGLFCRGELIFSSRRMSKGGFNGFTTAAQSTAYRCAGKLTSIAGNYLTPSELICLFCRILTTSHIKGVGRLLKWSSG